MPIIFLVVLFCSLFYWPIDHNSYTFINQNFVQYFTVLYMSKCSKYHRFQMKTHSREMYCQHMNIKWLFVPMSEIQVQISSIKHKVHKATLFSIHKDMDNT